MTMTVTVDEIQNVINDGVVGLVCSTTSRNRDVRMFLSGNEFVVTNSSNVVIRSTVIDEVVRIFNYFASRRLCH
jgi:hypothetical protein